jgi:hypothetical protein
MKALSREGHGMMRNKMVGGRGAQGTNQHRAALAIAARLCVSFDVRAQALLTESAFLSGVKIADLCPMAPASRLAHRGCWATRAFAFVFGVLWLLALASSLQR